MISRPTRPRPDVIPGDASQTLLRRVLRIEESEPCVRRVVLADDATHAIALVDSGDAPEPASADRSTALHLLWARNEPSAAIEIEGCGRISVAPGDTITLAPGMTWRYGPGLLACEIGGPADSEQPHGRIVGPTHGIERFDGHNRQTLCAIAPSLTVERWKITQPLILSGGATVVNLVEPMALVWSGGADLLGRGELRIVPPTLDRVTLLPDGLGYALVIRTNPDIAALRRDLLPEQFASIALF